MDRMMETDLQVCILGYRFFSSSEKKIVFFLFTNQCQTTEDCRRQRMFLAYPTAQIWVQEKGWALPWWRNSRGFWWFSYGSITHVRSHGIHEWLMLLMWEAWAKQAARNLLINQHSQWQKSGKEKAKYVQCAMWWKQGLMAFLEGRSDGRVNVVISYKLTTSYWHNRVSYTKL